MDEELHDVVIAVTDFHVLGNQIPLITGELTSVTAYSNSIRDNIPYRLICYSNGSNRKKGGLENFSILLHSLVAPNQISNLSGSKCKGSSACGAMGLRETPIFRYGSRNPENFRRTVQYWYQ
jgi:hypothetical protein